MRLHKPVGKALDKIVDETKLAGSKIEETLDKAIDFIGIRTKPHRKVGEILNKGADGLKSIGKRVQDVLDIPFEKRRR